jgi:hypothetical protein
MVLARRIDHGRPGLEVPGGAAMRHDGLRE